MSESMKELAYDGSKCVVEVARKDANGNTIDSTYLSKTDASSTYATKSQIPSVPTYYRHDLTVTGSGFRGTMLLYNRVNSRITSVATLCSALNSKSASACIVITISGKYCLCTQVSGLSTSTLQFMYYHDTISTMQTQNVSASSISSVTDVISIV